VELLVKRENTTQINKIDKSVPDIAVILEINGEIEKVIASPKILIKSLKHHFFRILIWNIPYHQGGLS